MSQLIKRSFDLVTSLLGAIILSPALLIIALFIKFSSKGPVIFKQKRTGRSGKLFTMYKFRTMTVGHGGNTISVKGEARITPVGVVLRKYKLDELPELWNVIIGDMSLVGPRPDMPEYYEKLEGDERLILKLRPGITGPASLKYSKEEEILSGVEDPVKYNDEVIWPDKVKINLDYYFNRNFIMDLKIIFNTIFGNS